MYAMWQIFPGMATPIDETPQLLLDRLPLIAADYNRAMQRKQKQGNLQEIARQLNGGARGQ